MNCNKDVHDELKSMEYITCLFCDEQLQDRVVKYETCCENMSVDNKEGKHVCVNCGIVVRYDIADEYIDFYEKKNIVKHSVYHQKYHKKIR